MILECSQLTGTIDFLLIDRYGEENFCCCDGYHFLIKKITKNSGFTSDHQIQAGFTPLVSIGQDLHPVKNLNSRFSDKRSFCRVDPWKIGMPWPVLRDSILFLSRKHFWTRNLGVRWIFQIATLQSNLLRGKIHIQTYWLGITYLSKKDLI